MDTKDFSKKFPDEDALSSYFKREREKQGITCSECGYFNRKYKSYYIRQWECKNCYASI